MVQIGCSLAYQIIGLPFLYGFLAGDKNPNKAVEAERVNKEKCLVVTMGGAAGIAAAFRSPIGGVLYMMEDMASYWTHETTVRAFGATMAATLTFSLLLNASHGINYEALVVFDPNPMKADWEIGDLPFFFLLACACGVVSSLYSEGLYWFQKNRAGRKLSKKKKIIEVLVFSTLICTVPLFISSLFGCNPDPAFEGMNSTQIAAKIGADAAGGHRLLAASADDDHTTNRLVKYDCDPGEYNMMASLWLTGEEGAIKTLYSRGNDYDLFSLPVLFTFLPIYLVLAMMCGGLSVPFGTFVPNLFMGAAMGRAFGIMFHQCFPGLSLSSPGTYALIGAASMLGGYTRMTLTITVMIAEASGDISSTIPVMFGVQVARFVASIFAECYDEKMMELRNIAFLHDAPSRERKRDTASSIMYKVENLKMTETLSSLKKLTAPDGGFDHFTAFPVVNDAGAIEGIVQFSVLKKLLEYYMEDRQFGDHDSTLIPLEELLQKSPYIVLDDFPLENLFPIFYKLRVRHVVVMNNQGKPIGVIHRTHLIEVVVGSEQHTSHTKIVSKLNLGKTAEKVKQQSVRLSPKANESGNGYDGMGRSSDQRNHASIYGKGEIYDEDVESKDNVRKLVNFLTFGRYGRETFKERERRSERAKSFEASVSRKNSEKGLELATIKGGAIL